MLLFQHRIFCLIILTLFVTISLSNLGYVKADPVTCFGREAHQGVDWRYCNLAGADLRNADLRDGYLIDANFSGANLEGADLSGAFFFNTNTGHASTLRGANLHNATLVNTQLMRIDLQYADLSGANLQNADMEDANLNHANLQGANLKCDSSEAFNCTNLFHTNLQYTDLRGADLSTATIQGTNFTGADMRDAKIDTTNWSDSDLSRVNFEGMHLRQESFSGMRLAGANFKNADLIGASFDGANLRGADFSNARLDGADLHSAYLADANLKGISIIYGNGGFANLAGTNLTGTNLIGANLEGANMYYADLNDVDLHGTNLHLVNLKYSKLHNADLSQSVLTGADMSNADLNNTNLSGAILEDTILTGTNLNKVVRLQIPTLSPLKQIQFGTHIDDIVCYPSKVLIEKWSRSSATCMDPMVAEKLTRFGWGKIRTPVLSISASVLVSGTQIDITGQRFQGNSSTSIFLDDAIFRNTKTDAWGRFQTYIIVPNDTSIGSHNITATDAVNDTGIANIQVITEKEMLKKQGYVTLNYTITGGQVIQMKSDSRSQTLVISLVTTSNGNLIIIIPRTVIDAKAGSQDDKFFVLNDGQEVNYEEINKTSIDRALSIPFTKGTQNIEIIGTQYLYDD